MAWLTLSPGRKVKLGLTFEHPDDSNVELTADPEALAQAAEGLMTNEVTPETLDKVMGLTSMPVAQLTIITKQSIGQDMCVFLTKDELRRISYESTALVKAMDRFGELVDETMGEYRKRLRERVSQGEEE